MSSAISQKLQDLLQRSHALQEGMERDSLVASTRELENWQKARLIRTYSDFGQRPTHAAAVVFFAEELYAPADLGTRDMQLTRMVPLMVRLLSESVLQTVAMALEVQNLSLHLDIETARPLASADINIPAMDQATYADAYRNAGNHELRQQQIRLIVEVGGALDLLVHKPAIYQALLMARWPARIAGLSELQRFLENGFSAFRAMTSADEFLRQIEIRETRFMQHLLDGEALPSGGESAATTSEFAW